MNFALVFVDTLADALALKQENTRWFAGGTELIPEMKAGLLSSAPLDAPLRWVNLKGIGELREIKETREGVRIGALATLAEIAEDERIRQNYRALAQACELSASPQIRNVATIGGNLCQDSRCAYFRNRFSCFLHGGQECFMREGENREAAVIGYRDCVHVHPSDPAIALAAFDAQIVAQSRAGERIIAAHEFFRAPDAENARLNVLNADDLVTAIRLPPVSENTRSAYVKAMDRAAWAFALASAAVKFEIQNSKVENVRIVLGGVAPIPWRESGVEVKLTGADWNARLVTQDEFMVLADANPLAHNRYKVRLARGMVKRALRECLPLEEAQ